MDRLRIKKEETTAREAPALKQYHPHRRSWYRKTGKKRETLGRSARESI